MFRKPPECCGPPVLLHYAESVSSFRVVRSINKYMKNSSASMRLGEYRSSLACTVSTTRTSPQLSQLTDGVGRLGGLAVKKNIFVVGPMCQSDSLKSVEDE